MILQVLNQQSAEVIWEADEDFKDGGSNKGDTKKKQKLNFFSLKWKSEDLEFSGLPSCSGRQDLMVTKGIEIYGAGTN